MVKMNLFGFSTLGRGIKGFIPQSVQTNDNTYEDFEQQRFQLVQAWNTAYPNQLVVSKRHRVITPFRAVTNSGDILSRKDYSCGGPCQTFQSRPNLHGLKKGFGAIQSSCDSTTVPAAACNIKYVYDSSDYSTYLKQKAIGKNYNDLSYGGNNYNAQQSAWRAIRRY
jgi:hypothetical protein